MPDKIYLAAFACLYILPYCYYLRISHGLGHKAEYLQLRRFLPCALLAVLPAALAGLPLSSGLFLSSLLTGVAWIITWPLLYYLSNRKVSSDFGFHLDIVFGLYIISWLTALKIFFLALGIVPQVFLGVMACIEFILLFIPLIQFCHYCLYGVCVNEDSMLLVQETNYNELIEFIKSFPVKLTAGAALLSGGLLILLMALNLRSVPAIHFLHRACLPVLPALAVFLSVYLYKRKKGVFVRTGIAELFLDTREYLKTSRLYAENMQQRLQDLTVAPKAPPFAGPSTIILIIGESASRDYMSAFTDYPCDSTPWLRGKKDSRNFLLFPNAYSCASSTVPSLERALTEFNQYNGKEFYSSCSILDIAHKAGYKTWWYSNQGHLGCADTPITLIANTAGTTKWTRQNINQVQYDESLLEYLDEIDPETNNFVVLHLKGSHFNFINRYPRAFTKFGTPGQYDLIPNYLNSLAYTDHVIEAIYNYATSRLNLQALVYFSDHATFPDRWRSPKFDGFGIVRIPLFVYLSDEYIARNAEVYKTLQLHEQSYFTNDLAYELLCGILNISSNHFDESGCLASPQYKYTRDTLKTNCGKLFIRDDSSGA